MKIGLIGLGKMGLNLALNMINCGHHIIGYDTMNEIVQKATEQKVMTVNSLENLINGLSPQRVIWLMIPAGKPVDDVIERLIPLLSADDIIIDGGNSNYKDTLRRYENLKKKGINFVDAGISGGTSGARYGACAMIGAEDRVFKTIEQLFKDICVHDGYLHTGANGSGHFVKMVHNGVEYGMMQAIGEGFEIINKSQFKVNMRDIARVWNHGSVIRGWLMELIGNAFEKDPELSALRGIMHSSGEGLWTVQTALELQVPAPVITESLFMRYRSLQEDTFTGKVVAALRNEFGGHAVEKK